MIKKLICLGVVLVLLFALTACGASELNKYKSAAKTALQDYANEKGQDNYTAENWGLVQAAVSDGKDAIDKATDKAAVDAVVAAVNAAIDEVESKETAMGTFYRLQEAYDEGLLTKEDLQSIASYENARPRLGHPEPLSDKVERSLKKSYANYLRSQVSEKTGKSLYPDATAEKVRIVCYYGTYDDCVAVMLESGLGDYTQADWTETIAGVNFHYNYGNHIKIWKPN